ncbi:MAG: hypothetical protein WCO02_13165 [Bacteroidota bacterium]
MQDDQIRLTLNPESEITSADPKTFSLQVYNKPGKVIREEKSVIVDSL